MTPAETETTLTYDKDQQLVRIFSAWPKDQRKIERAGFKPLHGNPNTGLSYEIPLNKLKWRLEKKMASQVRTKKILPENHPFLGRNRAKNGHPISATA